MSREDTDKEDQGPIHHETNDEMELTIPIEELEPRRSKRTRIEKSYGPDFYMYLVEGNRDDIVSSSVFVTEHDSSDREH